MIGKRNAQIRPPYLVWAFSGKLEHSFNLETWLEPTRELRRRGWEVCLLANGRYGVHSIEGVDVLCFPTINVYFLRHFVFDLILFGYILWNWRSVDFVIFHQTFTPWVLPLKLIRWLVFSHHPLFVMDTRTVLMEDLSKGTWRDRLRGWFYQLTARMGNSWADGQTTITQRMATAVKIPPERLWGVWSTGVAIENFLDARASRHWPGEHKPVHLIYTGVVNYERNLLALCKAVDMANMEGMYFLLTIVGNGTQRVELENFAADTDGKIMIKRPVPHDQIPGILARAHIGVIPFPDEEKFRVSSPLKLFEYLAAGLPVLATRIVCNTDVIGDDDFAFWANDGRVESLLDALRSVWERRADLEEMGNRAALAAEKHTWGASSEQLSDALLNHLHRADFEPGTVVRG